MVAYSVSPLTDDHSALFIIIDKRVEIEVKEAA